jgi:hypothetical protein
LITRFASLPIGVTFEVVATIGTESGVGIVLGATSSPGVGGGGGTNGRESYVGVGADTWGIGCATDGVGIATVGIVGVGIAATAGNGVGWRIVGTAVGVIDGVDTGVDTPTEGDRIGVTLRGVMAGFVSGVVAPTEIRRIAPQTLHRARTPFGGTFAGSTRNTDRQS